MDQLPRRQMLESIGLATLAALAAGHANAAGVGPLDPSPGPVGSTGVSLDQIYGLLQAGPLFRTVAFHSVAAGDLTEPGFEGGHEVRAASFVTYPYSVSGAARRGLLVAVNKGLGLMNFLTPNIPNNPDLVGNLTLKYYRRASAAPGTPWTQFFEVSMLNVTVTIDPGCPMTAWGGGNAPTSASMAIFPSNAEIDVLHFHHLDLPPGSAVVRYKAIPSGVTRSLAY